MILHINYYIHIVQILDCFCYYSIIFTDISCLQAYSGNYTNTEEPRRKRQDEVKQNHVLLFTIINPMYPITVVSKFYRLTLFVWRIHVTVCGILFFHFNCSFMQLIHMRKLVTDSPFSL